jgi:hypothetical protein
MTFERVMLAWRPGEHMGRLLVGSLRVNGTWSFSYDGPDLDKAVELGFVGYQGLQDFTAKYDDVALSTFKARLPRPERPDYLELLGAWHVTPDEKDTVFLLAATGGQLPTDQFEFIPVLEPVSGTSFLTKLAGIKYKPHSEHFRTLVRGSKLDLRPDPNNPFDPDAVEVLYGRYQLAFVKRGHSSNVCRALKAGLSVDVTLERMRVNGQVQEVLVHVQFR